MKYEVTWFDRYKRIKHRNEQVEAKNIPDLLHELEIVAFENSCGTLDFIVHGVRGPEGSYPMLCGSLDSLLHMKFEDSAIQDALDKSAFDAKSLKEAEKELIRRGYDLSKTGPVHDYRLTSYFFYDDDSKRIGRYDLRLRRFIFNGSYGDAAIHDSTIKDSREYKLPLKKLPQDIVKKIMDVIDDERIDYYKTSDGIELSISNYDNLEEALYDKYKIDLGKYTVHDSAIKDASIELDFDGSDADAQKLAKQFGCDVKHTGSANGYPTYRFSGPIDKLKRLAKKYGMDAEDFEEFVEDSAITDGQLVEPSKELINKVKQLLEKAGFIAEFKGFTGSGRAEFYIMSKEHSFTANDHDALNVLGSELEDVCDFCEKAKSPATFNISFNPSKHAVTGYFHVDKTYVKDAKIKDSYFEIRTSSLLDINSDAEIKEAIKEVEDSYDVKVKVLQPGKAGKLRVEGSADDLEEIIEDSDLHVKIRDAKPMLDVKKLADIVAITKAIPVIKDAGIGYDSSADKELSKLFGSKLSDDEFKQAFEQFKKFPTNGHKVRVLRYYGWLDASKFKQAVKLLNMSKPEKIDYLRHRFRDDNRPDVVKVDCKSDLRQLQKEASMLGLSLIETGAATEFASGSKTGPTYVINYYAFKIQ